MFALGRSLLTLKMIWSGFNLIWLLPANSISATCKDFQVNEMSWYCS
ncbi:hypothetical protein BS78_01G274600 [Paspalum vaginatum]|nr:hypothetical protein BS78_01G274600 [Paspalum vaginatum]